ncbi:MAG: PAS domain-containing protein, partial [Endomicrobium sp.]|nr:PAS domain-containing protein [Endomicrobium sp.]
MENIIDNCSEIESVIAMIRHFSPNQPIEDAVIYFWESHTDSNNDVRKIDATVDLIYKEFNISTCEKYEVRTGYLSRYNFLQQSIIHCSAEEIERAIVLGKKEEENWINRCQPQLPDFNLMDWKECISEEKNPFLSGCEELILDKIENCEEFKNAFQKSVNDFARKHNTDVYNGHMYILEETSWILTLPLLHPDKPIYLVHVDTANEAVEATFQHFPNLKKAVRWLSPRFITAVFKNTIDFLLDYRNNKHAGYSYATKNKDILKIFKRKTKTVNNTNTLLSMFEYVDAERRLLRSIIGKLPGHVYWLNSENTYLGCNDLQARLLNLQSREEIIGKTNYDFHNKEEAERINKINKEVMETGVPYEGEEFSSTPIGRLRNYISQKVPLYDTYGKSIGLLGLSIDITDRKKAEELEKKLAIQKELYEIAKRVAHDICSPLSALE